MRIQNYKQQKLNENISVVLEGDRVNNWETGDEISFKGYFFINWVADRDNFRPDFKIYFKVLNMGQHLSVTSHLRTLNLAPLQHAKMTQVQKNLKNVDPNKYDVHMIKKDIRLKNKLVKNWCKNVKGYFPHKLILMLSLLNSKLDRDLQEDSKV